MSFSRFLKHLAEQLQDALQAEQIEEAGHRDLQLQRLLKGQCIHCGLKLPLYNPSIHCEPDCRPELMEDPK